MWLGWNRAKVPCTFLVAGEDSALLQQGDLAGPAGPGRPPMIRSSLDMAGGPALQPTLGSPMRSVGAMLSVFRRAFRQSYAELQDMPAKFLDKMRCVEKPRQPLAERGPVVPDWLAITTKALSADSRDKVHGRCLGMLLTPTPGSY